MVMPFDFFVATTKFFITSNNRTNCINSRYKISKHTKFYSIILDWKRPAFMQNELKAFELI